MELIFHRAITVSRATALWKRSKQNHNPDLLCVAPSRPLFQRSFFGNRQRNLPFHWLDTYMGSPISQMLLCMFSWWRVGCNGPRSHGWVRRVRCFPPRQITLIREFAGQRPTRIRPARSGWRMVDGGKRFSIKIKILQVQISSKQPKPVPAW